MEFQGKNLTIIRFASGVTMQQMSKDLGIPQSRISNIENGYCPKYSTEMLDKIAAYFGMDTESLFFNGRFKIMVVKDDADVSDR